MFDLRAYNDAIFRVDEVLSAKFNQWLQYDKRYFYDQDDTNRQFLAFMYDIEPKSRNLDETKELLKEPFKVYFNEATFNALDTALKDFYTTSNVKEWYEYGGAPYHFKLELEASKIGITQENLKKTDEIVNTYKNVRSVYEGVSIKIATKANTTAGGYLMQGETISVMPYVLRELETKTGFYHANTFKTHEIINVF
ncbi:phage tail protein [Campylobacter gastrosuis]|uniref:Phage tail protein n=1 Tax=Campylobacter gastrosuis TaxID=2974576 RepID=A0ABT7HSP0_9BACT|nr:phage tail protein [Campylobacter gastrosuis]MDL0089905.1 phage tail protein [Campylobacter gastrosuis]